MANPTRPITTGRHGRKKSRPDCPCCKRGILYTVDSRYDHEAAIRTRKRICRTCDYVCWTEEITVREKLPSTLPI